MWTSYRLLLAALLISTGSLNTIFTKWADKIEAKSSDGMVRPFHHPFFQALVMFFGEILCLLYFHVLYAYYSKRSDNLVNRHWVLKGNRKFRVSIFFIPAICDMIATSLMYVGLTMTYASSFQMLRGSLIAFVSLLSIAFLNKKISRREWFGIVMVILGLAVVGLSDFISSDGCEKINDIITGDFLIVMAQIIFAVQMVYEEYIVADKDVPSLQAVGYEGLIGFVVLALLHIPMYYIYVGRPFSDNPRGVIEDFGDVLTQIGNNPKLLLPLTGTAISVAFFNFAAISVTKEMSAATRSVLDSIRTLVIWAVTVAIGWQKFSPIQILGFILLVLGILVYNNVTVLYGNASSRRKRRPQKVSFSNKTEVCDACAIDLKMAENRNKQ